MGNNSGEEIWKPVAVEGLERYEVSTWGRVRNSGGKIVSPASKSSVYLYLEKKQLYFSLPELVAKTFIPNPNNYPDVNILDEKSGSNAVDNLQWGFRYSPRTYILDGEEVTELSIYEYKLLIDPEDYNRVKQHRWILAHSAKQRERERKYYFYKYYQGNKETQRLQQPLQSFLLCVDCYSLSGKVVDHINGNTLDNRKKNLRITDDINRGNGKSKKKAKNNTSGFKGVSLGNGSKLNPWRAKLHTGGKHIHLGLYPTPELAHEAYCKAAIKYFGEYANFG